jgi:hypothetical protein
MRGISPRLLYTTILDPALLDTAASVQYTRLAEGGVSLRMCLPAGRTEYPTSLFGPVSRQLYSKTRAQRICTDFRDWRYPPKARLPRPEAALPATIEPQPVDPVELWLQSHEYRVDGPIARTLDQMSIASIPGGRKPGVSQPVDLLGPIEPNMNQACVSQATGTAVSLHWTAGQPMYSNNAAIGTPEGLNTITFDMPPLISSVSEPLEDARSQQKCETEVVQAASMSEAPKEQVSHHPKLSQTIVPSGNPPVTSLPRGHCWTQGLSESFVRDYLVLV